MSKKIDVALIYDFDGTLSPGNMQEFGFIQATGKSAREFWDMNNKLSQGQDANNILTYMYLMLREAKVNNISLRKESFMRFGSKVELFKGVKEWFGIINDFGKSLNLNIKHYINSSGLREMIEGTPIAGEFENIYACSYLYNVDGIAFWPAVAVDYTTKTQFLFKINKGIKKVSDNTLINKYVPEDERPIPFSHMIYFGDGETDIPCMKLVKEHGGFSIAVYNPLKSNKKEIALQLIRDNRVDFVSPADYREGKELIGNVRRILKKISADYEFQRLLKYHRNLAKI